MSNVKDRLKDILSDTLFWRTNSIVLCALYGILILLQFIGSRPGDFYGYIQATEIFFMLSASFYFLFFSCELFWRNEKIKFILTGLLFFIFMLVCIELFQAFKFTKIYADNIQKSQKKYILRLLLTGGIYFLISIAAIIIYFLRHEKIEFLKQQQMESEKAALQKALLNTELKMLRSQINPHFLHNCLNFIYGDIRKTNPESAEAILLLSGLMRYSVSESARNGSFVLLEEDLLQVENLIRLNRIRFKESIYLNFETHGDLKDKYILSLITLTLVENLFKYGDLSDKSCPAKIICTVNDKQVELLTTNKFEMNNFSPLGLGLQNIRQRLQIIYGDRFSLDKIVEGNIFSIHLKIPLKSDYV